MKRNNTYIINRQVIAEPTSETKLQQAVIEYVHRHYPGVEIFAHAAADTQVEGATVQGRRRLAQMARSLGYKAGMPDLFLNAAQRGYTALRIESKTIKACPFKKDGTIKAGEHLFKQACYLSDVKKNSRNLAVFCWGLENHLRLVDWYMNPEFIEGWGFDTLEFKGSNGYTPEVCVIDRIIF